MTPQPAKGLAMYIFQLFVKGDTYWRFCPASVASLSKLNLWSSSVMVNMIRVCAPIRSEVRHARVGVYEHFV